MDSLPIVPFGKYKGQPITSLINDTKYLEWCKLQEWFQKFPVVYNICVNQTITTNDTGSKTPEHNKLQNLFLERKFNIEFINHLYRFDKSITLLQKLYCDEEYYLYCGDQKFNFNDYGLENSLITPIFETIFNWDVCLLLGKYSGGGMKSNGNNITLKSVYNSENMVIYEKLFNNIKHIEWSYTRNDCWYSFADKTISLYIEIKPLMGDDYPNVLRKMSIQIKLTNDKNGLYILFVSKFSSSSTTTEQLVAIFKQSNIIIVFIDDMYSSLPNNSIAEPQILRIIPQKNEIIIPDELQSSKKSKTLKDYFNKM